MLSLQWCVIMLCFSSAGDAVKQPCTAALKTYQSNVVQPFIPPPNYSIILLFVFFLHVESCAWKAAFFFLCAWAVKMGGNNFLTVCLPLFLLLFSVIKGSCPCSMPLQGKLYIHINISTRVVCKTSVHAVVFFLFIKFNMEFTQINCIPPCLTN